jgi:molybdate transport system substrate-binding protein
MKNTLTIILGSVVMVGALIAMLMSGNSRSRSTIAPTDANGETVSLKLFCAAANRKPIEAICLAYEKEFGRHVDVQFGSSQSLLSSLAVSDSGDLFLPADDSYIEMAKQRDLVAEVFPLANMHVVLAVKKGNPKNIQTLDDVLRVGVRLVQADPESAAIGKVVRDVLRKAEKWDACDKATIAYRTTISDAANDVVIGAAFAAGYDDLEIVRVDDFQSASSLVALSVAASSENPQAAIHFARYASARDRGLAEYEKLGFSTTVGDVWSDTPELTVFAGSMLRPAIEDTITKFEQREGIKVSRVYNGCGILVAQMQGGQTPDVYFACDKEFMDMVPDLFPESVDVSQNELVILVQKGNPHGIKNLKDLGNPGLRVGVGHEKQCAMGWLTQNTLREGGIEKEVMANVTVQSPTGDMLVNQMLAGALDGAVVYLSNAAGAGDKLEAYRIEGLECAIAIQPFAIRTGSPNAQTASRLFAAINSRESQETFIAEGFQLSTPVATGPLDE